jgi:hypothetical protein
MEKEKWEERGKRYKDALSLAREEKTVASGR